MTEPRRYVCHPPVDDWARVIAANRAILEKMTVDVQGVSAAELRTRARRRVLELAGMADAVDRPLIVTGHQPQFYHPGIWVKAFTVTAEARRQGGVGLNLIVDHDAGELAAEIPWRETAHSGDGPDAADAGARPDVADAAAGADVAAAPAGPDAVGAAAGADVAIAAAGPDAADAGAHPDVADASVDPDVNVAAAGVSPSSGLGARAGFYGPDGGAGRLRFTKEYLVPPVGGRPLETLPPPGDDEVEAFLRRIEGRLRTLRWDEGMSRFHLFAEALREAAGRAGNAAEVGWLSRSLYERALGETLIPDVPVSRISGTPEFLRLFVHWVVHADAMRAAYNEALDEHRRQHRVRSRANPFPDLLVRPDGAVELPFWGLTPQGVRRKLYARRTGDVIELTHLEGVYARLPATGGDEAVNSLMRVGVQVRPRAVPLTVFHRLFVADLFVHGTGGGRYDEVTDRFIKKVFHVQPPRYAVVSATLHLPLGEPPVPAGALRSYRRKLRDLKFNPQRYAWELGELDDALVPLLGRKEELIDAIQAVDRADRRPDSTLGGAAARGPESTSGTAVARRPDLTSGIASARGPESTPGAGAARVPAADAARAPDSQAGPAVAGAQSSSDGGRLVSGASPASRVGGRPSAGAAHVPPGEDGPSTDAAARSPGLSKRALTREIERVNAALYEALAPVVQRTRQELAALEEKAEAGAVATRRTYPFFLHSAEDVRELLCEPSDGAGEQTTFVFPTGGR